MTGWMEYRCLYSLLVVRDRCPVLGPLYMYKPFKIRLRDINSYPPISIIHTSSSSYCTRRHVWLSARWYQINCYVINTLQQNGLCGYRRDASKVFAVIEKREMETNDLRDAAELELVFKLESEYWMLVSN